MTPEEKNNLISYLKQHKKLDTEIKIIGLLLPIFISTNFIFLVSNQKIWTIINLIFLTISAITLYVMCKNQEQLSGSIILLLKDYNIITIHEENTELYNKKSIIDAAKNNRSLDLRTNIHDNYTSAIKLLKEYPDLKSIKRIENTYTINELILDYQNDIIKICNKKFPKTIIKYQTNEPIGKAELKK